ncbi:RDD family protein [Asanoa sp. NPDC049518]|uniref:RDD family protein n=1 Tax=unclassified Asanoa TaxID=2685164 RepID=UPI003436CCF1
MHPDPQATPGARDPRQPGPPAGYPPAGPGHIPMQPGYAGPPPPWRPPVGPTGHPLAGFGDRFLAYLIDGLILSLATAVLACPMMIFLVGTMANAAERQTDDVGGIFLLFFAIYGLIFLLQFVFAYLYFVEYQLRSGQTLGKRVMSLRVQPISGQPFDRAVLVRRYLVQFVAGTFIPFFSFVDGLWQLWDQPLQQTLHDKAAQTVVAKVVQ